MLQVKEDEMGIGQLRCHVIDVNDLAVAEAFWSAVTGLPVIPSVFPGRCSPVGTPTSARPTRGGTR
jgi:hypothetical protein